MKTKLLALSIIVGFGVSCQNSDQLGMSGQNVELSYQVPDGAIKGQMNFDLNGGRWSEQEIKLHYDEIEKTIQLIGNNQSASFEAPSWWSPLLSINASGSGLNITHNNPRSITLRDALVNYSEDSYRLSGVSLNCGSPVLNQRPLENCLQSGTLKFSRFIMGSAQIVQEVLSYFGSPKAAQTEVRNLELKFNRENFNLEAKVDLSLSVTIKGEGKVEYLNDSSGYDLRIKVDKLRASFLNIKDKLFDELKKSEGKNLKVASPYIYIAFDQE